MRNILWITLLVALTAMLGCGGGGGDAEQAQEAMPAAEAEVATHDCEGDCGMTAVPMDKLTKVDDKYLCTGCVKKAEAKKDHDHG